jgi:hypothetical protein
MVHHHVANWGHGRWHSRPEQPLDETHGQIPQGQETPRLLCHHYRGPITVSTKQVSNTRKQTGMKRVVEVVKRRPKTNKTCAEIDTKQVSKIKIGEKQVLRQKKNRCKNRKEQV